MKLARKGLCSTVPLHRQWSTSIGRHFRRPWGPKASPPLQPPCGAPMHTPALDCAGWPPPASSQRGVFEGEHVCRCCQGRFADLWVHRKICLQCEVRYSTPALMCSCELGSRIGQAALRAERRCPFGSRCPPLCPHELRCFVCDMFSCHRCRPHRPA